MSHKKAILVGDKAITITTLYEATYLSVSDMEKAPFTAERWLCNAAALELLGSWEQLYNPDFDKEVFEVLMGKYTWPTFSVSVKEWCAQTRAIGLYFKPGRNSGLYAHRDIATEFAGWVLPKFKLQLVKALQDSGVQHSEWSFRRSLAATNYKIHSSAVKTILPTPDDKNVYSEEAELINQAVFGQGSREWKAQHPGMAGGGKTIRDYADTHQLIVLSNLESINAVLIRNGLAKEQRYTILRDAALTQLAALQRENGAIASPLKIA
ncbi:KilA-N domain-containing protein [Chitinophaga horti]|uniref:KilA-N domain-containing protein n=1 Tax=Chitinophaga horti TaxID=2920382 RepID=A0ABY6J5Y8_9BACT|nr:KilA-N domain-containing protein [Chitinophaga horti]UYQ94915.1 KilA-N domain-containing protein [Chitinophaga horti]